jgi:hypothetical protein
MGARRFRNSAISTGLLASEHRERSDEMMKKMVVGVVVSFCALGVFAQSPSLYDGAESFLEQSTDVFPPDWQPRTEELDRTELGAPLKGADVTEETVGDPYSFKAKVVFLGVSVTERVALRDDCTGYPPDAGRCIETDPAPAVTSVDESDLGAIVLPGKSTKTLLCFTVTPFATWQWENSTASQQLARMTLSTTVRIESDELLDPGLINPVTSLPFDGEIVLGTVSTFRQFRTIEPGELDLQSRSTTRSCTGGFISEATLRDAYGLSNQVIKDFFKNPITVSFGTAGDVSMTTSASYFAGIRLYGDK